jgi:hypothetical protein
MSSECGLSECGLMACCPEALVLPAQRTARRALFDGRCAARRQPRRGLPLTRPYHTRGAPNPRSTDA